MTNYIPKIIRFDEIIREISLNIFYGFLTDRSVQPALNRKNYREKKVIH